MSGKIKIGNKEYFCETVYSDGKHVYSTARGCLGTVEEYEKTKEKEKQEK